MNTGSNRTTYLHSAKNIRFGKKIALYSFLIGSLFFLLHLVLRSWYLYEQLVILGYLYLVLAFFVNVLFVCVLFINMLLDKEMRMKLIQTIGIMLLNIPIAYFYVLMFFNQF